MRTAPTRIVLVLPCCIGDVVMATPTLQALRRAYPQAHITWAVGGWSRAAIEQHPALDAVLDTGPAALPVKSAVGFWHFVRQLRAQRFDLAVSLVRSPLMSAALALSGIPHRAGLDSAGRGFGYTIRAPISPQDERHEADIYLDVPRALGLPTAGLKANCPPTAADLDAAQTVLNRLGLLNTPFMLVNPAGGNNPGMHMDSKRYPPAALAALADGLSDALGWPIVLVGGPKDSSLVEAVQQHQQRPAPSLVGQVSLRQIAALASLSRLYIGNDTGLTHLAAAAGAPTVMLMGPTSPTRYAPYTDHSIAIRKPAPITRGGVAQAVHAPAWDWERDGIHWQDALRQILAWVNTTR